MALNLAGEVRDQAAHVAAAMLILGPIAASPSTLTFAWAGFCIGLVREISEGPPFGRGSVLDIIFWTLGGASAAIFGGV